MDDEYVFVGQTADGCGFDMHQGMRFIRLTYAKARNASDGGLSPLQLTRLVQSYALKAIGAHDQDIESAFPPTRQSPIPKFPAVFIQFYIRHVPAAQSSNETAAGAAARVVNHQ